MVHFRWADRRSLMLDVAAPTLLDRRVERGRLLREDWSIGVVAGEAGCRLDPPVGGVAGLALRVQERMRSRKRPRARRGLPDRERRRAGAVDGQRHRHGCCDPEDGQGQIDRRSDLHPSHRNP